MANQAFAEQLQRHYPNVALDLRSLNKSEPRTSRPQREIPWRRRDYGYHFTVLDRLQEEGVDHINIATASTTQLGRLLGPESTAVGFEHPEHGLFRTTLGYLWWLRDENKAEIFRSGNINRIRLQINSYRRARTLRPNAGQNVPFHYLVSMWLRLKSNLAMALLLRDSTVPFDMYYVEKETNVRVRLEDSHWACAVVEECRRALKKRRAPKWQRFATHELSAQDSQTLEFFTPIELPQPLTEAQIAEREVRERERLLKAESRRVKNQPRRQDKKVEEAPSVAEVAAQQPQEVAEQVGETGVDLGQKTSDSSVEVVETPTQEAPAAEVELPSCVIDQL
jgi:hypothetical protein